MLSCDLGPAAPSFVSECIDELYCIYTGNRKTEGVGANSHGNVGGNSNHATALKLWYSIGYYPFMVGGEGEGFLGNGGGGVMNKDKESL